MRMQARQGGPAVQGEEEMKPARNSPGEANRFCAAIGKTITGFQCQLYQGVDYKKDPTCMNCSYRNEARDGEGK